MGRNEHRRRGRQRGWTQNARASANVVERAARRAELARRHAREKGGGAAPSWGATSSSSALPRRPSLGSDGKRRPLRAAASLVGVDVPSYPFSVRSTSGAARENMFGQDMLWRARE